MVLEPDPVDVRPLILLLRPQRRFLWRVGLELRCLGRSGVRPLCYLKSEILVSVPGEDDEEKNVEVAEEDRAQLVLIASDRILNALNEYPVEVWGEALGATVASLFASKQDAEQIAQEDKDKAAEV